MFICLFVRLFVCWTVCFFILIILGHPQEYTLKILWGSDLIWLRYSGSKKCFFVCLFVCLFVELFVFYFNHLRTPTEIYPENFVRIQLDLADILFNVYLFVCLLTCLFFILIILRHTQDYTLKILWRSNLI